MQRIAVALVFVIAVAACSALSPRAGGWVTLLDGSNPATLERWSRIGDANWRIENGAVVADSGSRMSFLVTQESYRDLEVRAEFWADASTNSGVFLRVTNPGDITPRNSYEFNIYDDSPNAGFATGSIVAWAKASPTHKAGGRWNTYVVRAQGGVLSAQLNGVETVRYEGATLENGRIAVQWTPLPPNASGGASMLRKLEMRPL